jgi:putative phage-type endonuclease
MYSNINKLIIEEIKAFNNNSIKYYCEPKYKTILYDHLYKKFSNFFDGNNKKETIKNDIDKSINLYLYNIFIPRSYIDNKVITPLTNNMRDIIKSKLDIVEIKDKNNPPQRTELWYKQRFNLLSASNIYKALGSQSMKNALIYEKCKPIDTNKYNSVNINSAMHWGQKYEPVAQMYYEYKYDAIVKEYGCIPHSNYDFIGASPDGINVKYDSDRYGRLVEIKSVVSRKLTGIPKKDYWVQTQLQMECTDLDECDFLECDFKEYDSYKDFLNDGDFNKTANGNYKGIIMCFYKDNKPIYHYSPFQCSKEEYELWDEKIMKEYTTNDTIWICNYYWYLDDVSCVLIPRNKLWFKHAVIEFEELWSCVLYDRINGYEHRKPKQRNNKKQLKITKTNNINNNDINSILFDDLYNNKELLEAENKHYIENDTSNNITNSNKKIINILTDNKSISNINNDFNIIKKIDENSITKSNNQDTTSKPNNQDTTSKPNNQDTTSKPNNQDTTSKPNNQDTTLKPNNDKPDNQDTTSKPNNQDTTLK